VSCEASWCVILYLIAVACIPVALAAANHTSADSIRSRREADFELATSHWEQAQQLQDREYLTRDDMDFNTRQMQVSMQFGQDLVAHCCSILQI